MRPSPTLVLILLISAAWSGSAAAADAPESIDLARCYRLALDRSETLAIRAEIINQADEHYRQALAGVLPSLSFNASYLYQGADSAATAVAANSRDYRFTVRQTLFSGFREFSAMAAGRSETTRQTLLLRRAQVLVYLDVARAFYSVVLLEKDLENLTAERKLTQDRIVELRTRLDLGKSRESEVLNVDSQLSTLDAQAEQTASDIATARDLLAFITGADLDRTRLDGVAAETETALPPLDHYLGLAGARTDVKAASQEVETARDRVYGTWGGILPGAGLAADWYVPRNAKTDPVAWDAMLTLEIPLFQGGRAVSAKREAQSAVRAAEQGLSLATRNATLEIKDRWVALSHSLAQTAHLHDAYEKARKSYDLQVEEYRHGLVTNLDVLTTMGIMVTARRDWDHVVLQNRINRLELLLAVEALP